MGSSASSYGYRSEGAGHLGRMSISLLFYLAATLLNISKADGTIVEHDGVHPVPAPFGPGVTTITDSGTISPGDLSSVTVTSIVNTILETISTTASSPTLPPSGILPVPDGAIPPAALSSFISTIDSVSGSGTVSLDTPSPSVLQNTSFPDTVSSAMGMTSSQTPATSMFMPVTGGLSPEITSPFSTSATSEDPTSSAFTYSATPLQRQTASASTSVIYTTISIFQTALPSQTQTPSNVTFTQPPMAASTSNTSAFTTPWSTAGSTTTTTSNLMTTLEVQTTVIVTTTRPTQTFSILQSEAGNCTTQGQQLAQQSAMPVRRLFSDMTSFSSKQAESGGLCISVLTTTVYVTPTIPNTWTTITVTASTPSASPSTLPLPTPLTDTVSVTTYVTLSSVSILPMVTSAAGASASPDVTSMHTSSSTSLQPQTTVIAATVSPTTLNFSSMVASYRSTPPTSASTSAALPTIAPVSASFNFSSMVASYRSSGGQQRTAVSPSVSVMMASTFLPKMSPTVTRSTTGDHESTPMQASVFSPAPTLAPTGLNFSSMVANYRTQDAKPSRTSVFKDPALSHLMPVTTKAASEHSMHTTSSVQGRSDGNQLASWITKLLPWGAPTPTTLLTVPRPTTSVSAGTAGAVL